MLLRLIKTTKKEGKTDEAHQLNIFCYSAEAAIRRCFFNIGVLKNFHSKAPALESLFNKVAGFIKAVVRHGYRPATLLRRDSNIGVFL